MKRGKIASSAKLRNEARKAVFAIVLFALTYLVLVLLAISLTVLCVYLGLKLILFQPAIYTIGAGIGLSFTGSMVLFFLVKFLFKKHSVDRSHFIRISKNEQPELFAFIGLVVKEVNTHFPKRIYFSADVNASVFYDSSFWSLFFPVRKNLLIGMGLINTLTVSEFKAILAHEFGHFSQHSMRIGSFVYYVNRAIHNMLYENEEFDALAGRWKETGAYFLPFLKLVQGIQWILRRLYGMVNLRFMSLSREMEFHADHVAAHVAGPQHLGTGLLRTHLAEYAYNAVLNFYNERIKPAVATRNIYPKQRFLLNFYAQKNNIPVLHDLPQVSIQHIRRFNKSRLVVKDQWASHPSLEDRIEALGRLRDKAGRAIYAQASAAASELLDNIVLLQEKLSAKLFSQIDYQQTPAFHTTGQFISEFMQEYEAESFDALFNSYYDSRNPPKLGPELTQTGDPGSLPELSSLFDDEMVDLVYTSIAIENDIHALGIFAEGGSGIHSFEYEGDRYVAAEAGKLIPLLRSELAFVKDEIFRNDVKIYQYFLSAADRLGKRQEYESLYRSFWEADKTCNKRLSLYLEMVNDSAFLSELTPFDVIEEKMAKLKKTEQAFRREIASILKEGDVQGGLTDEIMEAFTHYLSRDWVYFSRPVYNEDALNVIFTNIDNYHFAVSRSFFRKKKQLLDFKVSLENSLRETPVSPSRA